MVVHNFINCPDEHTRPQNTTYLNKAQSSLMPVDLAASDVWSLCDDCDSLCRVTVTLYASY